MIFLAVQYHRRKLNAIEAMLLFYLFTAATTGLSPQCLLWSLPLLLVIRRMGFAALHTGVAPDLLPCLSGVCRDHRLRGVSEPEGNRFRERVVYAPNGRSIPEGCHQRTACSGAAAGDLEYDPSSIRGHVHAWNAP